MVEQCPLAPIRGLSTQGPATIFAYQGSLSAALVSHPTKECDLDPPDLAANGEQKEPCSYPETSPP